MAKSKSDYSGYNDLVSGVYSRPSSKTTGPIAGPSKGDMSGVNNPAGYKAGLLGKKVGYGTGTNKIPANPLGIQGGLLNGKGLGVQNATPNFANNPIGYKGGLLINKGRGK